MKNKNIQDQQSHQMILAILRGIKGQIGLLQNESNLDTDQVSEEGNYLNSSTKNEKMTFSSYEANMFKKLRMHFDITEDILVENLTEEYILREKMSKHRGIIFFTKKFNFVIKTITKQEKKHLLRIMPEYSTYLMNNPDTLISKIFGCFKVKRLNHKKIYFIIMNNIFPHDKAIDEVYDLKGSTSNRYSNNNSNITLKDIDWKNRNKKMFLKGKKILLMQQIEADTMFLGRIQTMDYSFVVGIRNSKYGLLKKKLFMMYKDNNGIPEEIKMDELQYDNHCNYNTSIFSREFGGYAADNLNEDENEVYFVGIIDILTYWSWKKVIEKFIGKLLCKGNISCADPKAYRLRFLDMIKTKIFYEN